MPLVDQNTAYGCILNTPQGVSVIIVWFIVTVDKKASY